MASEVLSSAAVGHAEPGHVAPAPALPEARRETGVARRWPMVLAFLAAVVAPFANAVGAYLRGYVPYGDEAIVVIRAYDVGTRLTPLIGMTAASSDVSRYAANHPGPLQFWLLSPFVRALGPTWGGIIGNAAIYAFPTAVVGWVLYRLLGRGAALVGLAVCLLASMNIGVFGHQFEFVPPFTALLPFLALMVVLWACVEEGAIWLPLACLFATYAVQCDIVFVGPVLVVGCWALLATYVRRRHPTTVVWMPFAVVGAAMRTPAYWRRRWRSLWHRRAHAALAPSAAAAGRPRRFVRALLRHPVWLAVLVAVLCWAAPIVQAARNSGGNLRALVDVAFSMAPGTGLAGASQALGGVLNLPPFAMGTHQSGEWARGLTISAVIPFILLAVLTMWAVRRRRGRLRRLLGLAWAGLVAAALSGFRFPQGHYYQPYYTTYAQAIWGYVWIAILVSGYAFARERWRYRVARVSVGAVAAALAMLATAGGAALIGYGRSSAPVGIAALVAAVVAAVGVVVVHPSSRHLSARLCAGVALVGAVVAASFPPATFEDSLLAWQAKAVPALTSQVLAHLPDTSAPPTAYLAMSAGGQTTRVLYQGLLAQLRSRHVPFLVANGEAATYGGRRTYQAQEGNTRGEILVVPDYATVFPTGARRIAAWAPAGWSEQKADQLRADVAAFVARSSTPLQLNGVGAGQFTRALAFTVPGTDGSGLPDPAPFLKDPKLFLQHPAALTALYQSGWVASPALPPNLQQQVNALALQGGAYAVWYVPGPLPPGSGEIS